MALDLNYKDAEDMPQRDLDAFIFQDKDDMNRFLEAVRDSLGLEVSAIHWEDPNEDVSRFLRDTATDIPDHQHPEQIQNQQ